MHSTHIWHKFHLYRSQIVFCTVFIFSSISLLAQNQAYSRRFLENYDLEEYHFGFYIGSGFTRFNHTYSKSFANSTSPITAIYSPTAFALKIGLMVDKQLSSKLSLRATPGINIHEKSMVFEELDINNEIIKKPLKKQTDIFEVPVMFKYKSERRKNSRMYILAGTSLLYEANIRKSTRASAATFPAKTLDFTLDYGFGYEHFMGYGKLTPEIRFSHGIRNLLVPNSRATQINDNISSLNTHTVTLYLFFE